MLSLLVVCGIYCVSIPLVIWTREPASEEVIPTGFFGPTLTEKAAMNMPSMRKLFELPDRFWELLASPLVLAIVVLCLPVFVVMSCWEIVKPNTYCDPGFSDASVESLSQRQRQTLDKAEREFSEHGFDVLDTCEYKSEFLLTTAVRYFLSADGQTIAAAYASDLSTQNFLGTFFANQSAVLTNGVNAKHYDDMATPEYRGETCWRLHVREPELGQLIDNHERWCRELQQQLGQTPLAIDPDQWQDAFIASERLTAALQTKKGEPVFPNVPTPPSIQPRTLSDDQKSKNAS